MYLRFHYSGIKNGLWPVWEIYGLDSQFSPDLFRDSVLVNDDIHGLESDECLRRVPSTFIFTIRTPRILDHIELLACLVFRDTIDQHTVVVGCLIVIVLLLAQLLCNLDLLARFLKHFLDLLILLCLAQAQPTILVRAATLHRLDVGSYGNTVTREALLADVGCPSDRIAVIDSVVEHLHQLVDRQVIRQVPAPVVLYLDRECGVERMVRERGQ